MKRIAIATQKGGAAKSTLTAILASYFQYHLQKKVLVVDLDYPQHSLTRYRDLDLDTMKQNEEVEQLMRDNHARGILPYSILSVPLSFESVCSATDHYLDSHPDTDYVIYDMPGTINNNDVIKVLNLLDYVFIPLEMEESVNWSSLDFLKLLNMQNLACQKFLFWNKQDRRLPRKIEYFQLLSDQMRSKGLNVLHTYIPLMHNIGCGPSIRGSKAIKSTIFEPYCEAGVNTNVPEFCQEIFLITSK